LIAAARRAAQVAAAEAADRPGDVRPSEDPLPAAAGGSARARLRSAVERHRRSLILGLAAVILGLGALQIGSRGVKEPEPDAVPSPAAGPVPQTPAPPAGTRPGSPVGTVRPEGRARSRLPPDWRRRPSSERRTWRRRSRRARSGSGHRPARGSRRRRAPGPEPEAGRLFPRSGPVQLSAARAHRGEEASPAPRGAAMPQAFRSKLRVGAARGERGRPSRARARPEEPRRGRFTCRSTCPSPRCP
jgi:hypothetical protein